MTEAARGVKIKREILLVEDEFVIENLLRLTLERDYSIKAAFDGIQALDMLKDKPDLIILDLMIPKMDGFEVLRVIRSNEATKKTPVIVLSAKHQMSDIRKAIDLGANEYITKPFEPDFLVGRIKTLLDILDKGLKSHGTFFEFGNTMNYIQQR